MDREGQGDGPKLTGEEIQKHNSRESCWVILHDKAYDVTEFLPGTIQSLSKKIDHEADVQSQNTPVDQR